MADESTAGKPGSTQQVQAAARAVRARFSLRRGIAAIVADLLLAAGTLLILFGLFMGWQAWLAWHQGSASQALVQARQQVARKISTIVTGERAAVGKALAQPALAAQLTATDDPTTRDAVAQGIKAAIHDAQAVTVYSAQLNEVLHGNLHQLGYARAAQLMTTLSEDDVGPAQSPVPKIISYAGPINGANGKPLAYATVDFADVPVRVALQSARVSAGRMDLRQSNKSGDIILASAGASSLPTADDEGVASRTACTASPPRRRRTGCPSPSRSSRRCYSRC